MKKIQKDFLVEVFFSIIFKKFSITKFYERKKSTNIWNYWTRRILLG